MVYLTILVVIMVVLGVAVVAYNPSPYFGALGLVVVAGMGCVLLSEVGEFFLSLMLFLIYLGGMMVVFVYTTALATDPYPEVSLGGTLYGGVLYMVFVISILGGFWQWWLDEVWVLGISCELSSLLGDVGVGEMYGLCGKMLMIGGWVLFLTLFVVLEMTRGLCRGAYMK